MNSKITSNVRTAIAATFMLIAAQTAQAQVPVVVNEGFEQASSNATAPFWPSGNLPFGWTQGKITPSTDANNFWDRMNNPGNNPVCAPHGGSLYMVRFRTGYIATANETGYLSSKPYDLSLMNSLGVGTSLVSFWVYRENTAGNDTIVVLANNSPDPLSGAPVRLQDTVSTGYYMYRQCTNIPPDPCGAWTQHFYKIPTSFATSNVYITIKVTHISAGVSANVYIDDFSIKTFPAAQAFVSMSLDYQNVANVSKTSFNNWIIGARVTVTGGVSSAVGPFIFAPTGSTNPGVDITPGSAKLWWTGGTNQFDPLTATLLGSYAFSLAVASFSINAPGLFLDNGNNYFWLTYDIPGGATSNNYVDADFDSATVIGLKRACGVSGCALTGARLIDVAYCIPTYTAGTSWLNGSYTDNDYVKRFYCPGDPLYPPGIRNDHNDIPIGSLPVGAGWNQDPCVTSAGMLNGSNVSPFSNHPPDYSKMPTAKVPPMCAGNPGDTSRTAVFLSTSVAPPTYSWQVQCGTWFGANAIAAWMDFNHDGIFNNAMFNTPGGEKLFQSPYMNKLTWFNSTVGTQFDIPTVGPGLPFYGNTTLRVREWYANNNMDPCNAGYYGEVEDYTVTIRPDCSPIFPGWKIWLGYTNDWNVNSNWCGGVPTIADNALIPGFGVQPYNRGAGTYHPVIKSGVVATAKKLMLLNDTVEMNAPIPGSLTLADSMKISTASSRVIVDSSFADTAAISNGLFTNLTNLIFRQSYRRQKMQLMYKTAELTAAGMIHGDQIDSIFFPIRVRQSTQPYDNFQISYYYAVAGLYFSVNTGYTGTLANVSVAPQFTAPITVYSNPSLNLSAMPAGGAYLKIKLSTPITVDIAGGRPLIITFCYENAGALSNNDLTFHTQTAGVRTVMLLSQLGAPPPTGWSLANTPAGCAMVDTTGYCLSATGTNGGFQRAASDFRPNLTFRFHRVFTKYPINVAGHWGNNGAFVPANSIVTFNSALILQNIDGNNPTTFDELAINNNLHVRQNQPVTVNDTMWLQRGRFILNTRTLTIMNGLRGAITQVAPNGYLYSEDLPPTYGLVNWKIGSNLGKYTFPFQSPNGGGTAIPFIDSITTGTITEITVGTYYPSTNPALMLPWPTGVTTINSYNNPAVSDAPNMVKRYWTITTPGSATGDLTFTFANPSELPTNGSAGGLVSQRWNGAPITWDYPTPGQGMPTTASVKAPGITNFNTPWVLTRQPEPLPIELLDFTAKAQKDKVKLDWITASERDCDHFIIERTTDGSNFTFIDRVNSKGSSSAAQDYLTYDEHPLIGLQFYRLTQTDINGAQKYSSLVPVTFGKETKFEIVTTVNYDDGSFDVVFNYTSELPYAYKIVDMVGNIVAAKSDLKAVNGSNIVNVKAHLASGVYTIMIHNQEETVAKKIFR